MIQKSNNEFVKHTYLCVADAIERVCDEELVHELLFMLNSSIDKDWSEFEKKFNTNQHILAADILHGMKGTIPIFSDKKMEDIMQKTELLLRTATSEIELKKVVEELRFQILGFTAELKSWAKKKNHSPFKPTSNPIV